VNIVHGRFTRQVARNHRLVGRHDKNEIARRETMQRLKHTRQKTNSSQDFT
jgi:hypothetical protein